ncbi:MAG: hypothetical protein IKS93_02280, partial [Methanobrevibacter sp.]|nr:hypothetical protein [Methanobrevibacter sp.]
LWLFIVAPLVGAGLAGLAYKCLGGCCKKCNKELKYRIIDSNFDQSQIEYDCECKKEWIAEVKFSDLNKSKTPIKHLPLY